MQVEIAQLHIDKKVRGIWKFSVIGNGNDVGVRPGPVSADLGYRPRFVLHVGWV
jgi:hypothetical protein